MSKKRGRVKEKIAEILYRISAAGRYGIIGFPDWKELKDDQRDFFRNKTDRLILSIPEIAEGLKAVEKGYNAKVDREVKNVET